MTTNTQITINPEVSIVNGAICVTSINVAKVFGKRHDNVVQSICNLQNDLETVSGGDGGLLKNQESSYINAQSKSQPMYAMNRDAFSLLVMGFTGNRALEWKLKYIQAFNMMESTLSSPAPKHAKLSDRDIDVTAALKKRMGEYVAKNLFPIGKEAKYEDLIKLHPATLATYCEYAHSHIAEFKEQVKELNATTLAAPTMDAQAIINGLVSLIQQREVAA